MRHLRVIRPAQSSTKRVAVRGDLPHLLGREAYVTEDIEQEETLHAVAHLREVRAAGGAFLTVWVPMGVTARNGI